jgi:hypothetical protein
MVLLRALHVRRWRGPAVGTLQLREGAGPLRRCLPLPPGAPLQRPLRSHSDRSSLPQRQARLLAARVRPARQAAQSLREATRVVSTATGQQQAVQCQLADHQNSPQAVVLAGPAAALRLARPPRPSHHVSTHTHTRARLNRPCWCDPDRAADRCKLPSISRRLPQITCVASCSYVPLRPPVTFSNAPQSNLWPAGKRHTVAARECRPCGACALLTARSPGAGKSLTTTPRSCFDGGALYASSRELSSGVGRGTPSANSPSSRCLAASNFGPTQKHFPHLRRRGSRVAVGVRLYARGKLLQCPDHGDRANTLTCRTARTRPPGPAAGWSRAPPPPRG